MVGVVVVVDLSVRVGVELADTPGNKKHNGNAAEPPGCGYACGEARRDKKDRTYDVADDG